MLEAVERPKWPLGRHPNICNTIFTNVADVWVKKKPLAKFVILLPLFLGSTDLEALIPKGGVSTLEAKRFKLVADTNFLPL